MIYMDNAALEKVKPEVIEVVVDTMRNHWGNASAVNTDFGLESQRIVENARQIIANEINANTDEIIFTGSGSESNSLAIDGFLRANQDYKGVTISCLEHSSISKNPNVHYIIGCDKYGKINIDELKEIHSELVSIQMANSEIGTIQDIKKISEILHNNDCVIHCDAVQAFGHIPIDVKNLGVDMLSATGQKIGSCLGSAFLYVKDGIKIESIIHGTQENARRGSTYNTPCINGFATAVKLIDWNEQKEIKKKRDYFIELLCNDENIKLNGSIKDRLPNNINVTIYNCELDNQQLVSMMSLIGDYIIAAGSACSTGIKIPSKVLLSIGLSEDEANHGIRITIDNDITYEQIDKFCSDLSNIIEQFKR